MTSGELSSALQAKAGDQGLQMRLGTLLLQRSASGLRVPLGQLSLQVDALAGPAVSGGGGGNVLVFDLVDSATRQARPAGGGGSGGGDILIFDVIDSVTPVATRIRIDARPDQQLEGSAAHWQWVNRPGPGEPLIATIRVLLQGQALNEVLEIRDAWAPQVQPMKIDLRLQF